VIAVARLRAATRDRAMRAVVVEAEDVRAALAALADARSLADYWREQATAAAPCVDEILRLTSRAVPGGTGCALEPRRVADGLIAAHDALGTECARLRALVEMLAKA
jgi:hypothetical protein